MNTELFDNWIGIEETVECLGVNMDTLRNWGKQPNSSIPAHKIEK